MPCCFFVPHDVTHRMRVYAVVRSKREELFKLNFLNAAPH